MTIAEKLAQQQGEPTAAPEQKNDLWGNLGAGGYSALNELGMGLPDFLVKNVGGSKNYQALKDFQEQHKTASDIGTGAGFVGSLFIPGGAVAKGAGALAKAAGAAKIGEKLGKAGEFLGKAAAPGEKLGDLALRGAGQAAEQAVPRALTSLDFTDPDKFRESVGNSLESLPASLAVGGGAGALLGRLAQRFAGRSNLGGLAPEGAGETVGGHALSEARKAVNNATLASAGLETRAVRSAAKALGLRGASAGRSGDEYVDDLAQGIRDYGINGKRQWEALVQKTQKTWDEVEDGFKRNAPEGWNSQLADNLTRDPDLLQHLAESGNEGAAADQLLDTAVHLANTPSLGTVRNKLSNIIKAGLHSSDGDTNARAQMAMAIKRKVDEYVEATSGVDMGNARGMYKLIQPFLMQEGKDALTVNQPLGYMLSPTAEKAGGALLGGQLATKGLSGLGVGGLSAASDAAQGQDVDWGKAATGAVVGGLVGPAAFGAARALANKAISKGVRAAGGALGTEGAEKVVEKVQTEAPAAAARGAALAVDKNVLGQNVPPTDPVAEGAKADAAEKEAPKEVVTKVQNQITDRFRSVLSNRLRFLHENYYPNVDPEDFMKAVQKKTANFTDMSANADLLFTDPEQRARFLREYQASLVAKKLDIDKALSPLAGVNVAGLKPDEEGFQNRDQLRELLIGRITGGDLKGRTPAVEKQVDAYISKVAQNPAMLADLARQLESPMLQGLGVA